MPRRRPPKPDPPPIRAADLPDPSDAGALFARDRLRPARRRPPPPATALEPLPAVDSGFRPVLPTDALVPPAPAPVAGPLSPRQRERILGLVRELDRRRAEALRLYQPLPEQLRFHQSTCRQRLVRGSNRSGKTLSSMVELAWAVTGTHPVPGKFPERDGRAYAVARDEKKIGEVLYRKLFRAGAFDMVRDPGTGDWRAYRGEVDDALGLKRKPAPPLIPPRYVAEVAWVSRKENIPKLVRLTNGWELSFFSSKADPDSIQGVDVDIITFDEEIVHQEWYPEAIARLVDRNGFFWWSATPQAGTQALFDLHLRAVGEDDGPGPDGVAAVEEFILLLRDNPHLLESAKRDFIASLDDESLRVRVEGEFAITGTRIYDPWFFPRGVHGVEPFAVPADWTHLLAIDPGAQVCAVLFAAIPPPKPDGSPVPAELFGDFVYIYDEVHLKHCDARRFAESLAPKVGDQHFEAYLIDHHGGRLTEIGSGRTPEQQYRDALKVAKVPHFCPPRSGSFVYASDDVAGGILKVREALRVRADGTSRLRVMCDRVPNFVREVRRYQWKVVGGEVSDKPLKRHDHQPDNLRYLLMHPGCRYRKPPVRPRREAGVLGLLAAKRKRESARARADGGGGITLGAGRDRD